MTTELTATPFPPRMVISDDYRQEKKRPETDYLIDTTDEDFGREEPKQESGIDIENAFEEMNRDINVSGYDYEDDDEDDDYPDDDRYDDEDDEIDWDGDEYDD